MDDYVDFNIAEKLQKNGFNKYSDRSYTKIGLFNDTETYKASNEFYCYAPTISQVLKWLRDEKNIHINIGVYPNGWNFFCCSCEKHDNGKFGDYNIYEAPEMHSSYEFAALAGIEYILDNLI